MAEGEATRRLTTIVAADVAGYSRLIAADEEGTLAALRAHRSELIDPKIAEYRGRVANTAGDSILIEWRCRTHSAPCREAASRPLASGRDRSSHPADRRWRCAVVAQALATSCCCPGQA